MKKSLLSLLALLLSFTQLTAKEEVYPVVVLGGGVGALTSALYLGRAGIKPLVIEGQNRGGAIAQSPHVQNWPGEIEISGLDLIEKIHNQAVHNNAEILSEEVVSVDFGQRPFTIITKDPFDPEKTRKIHANACIIAMGSNPNLLKVPGEDLYWTRGVYSCAVCDGALYKNQKIAVVGGGDAAILEAEYLANFTEKVYILVRKDRFRVVEEKRLQELLTRPNVEVLFNTTVEEIHGDSEKVTHLILDQANKKRPLDVAALFLAIGAKPNSQIFQGQLETDSQGYILLKNDQETSVKDVFAIGDIVDPIYKQAIIAAGEGAVAALQVVQATTKHSTSSETPIRISASHGKVIEITSLEQFEYEISKAITPIIIDFYATWCGPCKALNPMIDKWAKEYDGKVKFLKVDVSKQEEITNLYNIRSMPTVVVLNKEGKEVAKKVGTQEIAHFIKKSDFSKIK